MSAPLLTEPPPVRSAPAGRPVTMARYGLPAVTIGCWLAGLPAAFALVAALDLDPFGLRATMLPAAVGGVLLTVSVVLVVLRRAGLAVAWSAGAFPVWVAVTLRTALNGSAYGFDGLRGDLARMTAMAARYTVTTHSSDGIVAGIASEYPPLYPWAIGRIAVLTGRPAWHLMGVAEIVVTSAAVPLAFLLWRRLLTAPVALAVAVAGFAVYHDPWKAFEVLALAVTVPWLLLTFADPPRGRLHWLPAGLIGGLIVLLHHGYLLYGVLGVPLLAIVTLRRTPDRWGYVRHLALVAAVALPVMSPYVVPYAGAMLDHGGQSVADLYETWGIASAPFPLAALSLTSVLNVMSVVQAGGVAGLVWYRARAWWAAPLLCLTAGSLAYRLLFTVRFIADGHTGFIHHAAVLTTDLLAIAGVLTLARAAPLVLSRLRVSPPRGVGALLLACLIVVVADLCWTAWLPHRPATAYGAPGSWGPAVHVVRAHTEFRPDGGRSRFGPAASEAPAYPVTAIREAVAARLGPSARPRTLASDERLFAFLPWPGYIAPDRTSAGTPTRWDDRYAALQRLAGVADPGEFARRSAATAFGSIDLFVLRRRDGRWIWRPGHYPGVVTFTPRQFSPAAFDTVAGLPGRTVLAIRRR